MTFSYYSFWEALTSALFAATLWNFAERKKKKILFFVLGNSVSILWIYHLLNQITGPCRTACTKNLSEMWDQPQRRKRVSPVIECIPLAHAMSHSFPPYSCPHCTCILWYRIQLPDYLLGFFSKVTWTHSQSKMHTSWSQINVVPTCYI